MKILFIGDIYADPGVFAVQTKLPFIRKSLKPDLVIANAENAAYDGKSFTIKEYDRLKAAGVDYFTLGNHTYKHEEVEEVLVKDDVIRPYNYNDKTLSGKGFIKIPFAGKTILLMNLLGQGFMREDVYSPFIAARNVLEQEDYDMAFIDFHTETTSEKVVFANYISDLAQVVVGTHTHVATADERILNGRTAFITDVGMTGVQDSAIGANYQEVEDKYLKRPNLKKFRPAEGEGTINAVLIEFYDNTLKPVRIERVKA